jgi:hypothetical protein
LFSSRSYRVSSSTDKNGGRVFNGEIGALLAAQFGPDCDTVVTGSVVGAFYKWTILPPNAQPPPAWFTDFLQYMAQLRLNASGELEAVPVYEWLALRARLREALRQSAGHETPYSRILRRFVTLGLASRGHQIDWDQGRMSSTICGMSLLSNGRPGV